MKKLTALIVTIIMICCIPSVYAKSDRVNQNTAFKFLSTIGCINDELASTPNDTMTRAEFADFVVSLNDAREISSYDKPIFLDVALNTPYAAQINMAYNLGIIGRDSTAKFRPADMITVNEAAGMLTCMLGYGVAVKDGNYLAYASQLKLFDGIVLSDYSYVTVSQAAMMAYNALNAKPMEILGDGSRKTSNAIFMENKLDIYYRTGNITATKNMNVDSNDILRDGKIKIDGVEYDLGQTGFSALVGQNVRFWYSLDTDDNRVIRYIENADEDISSLFIDYHRLDTKNSAFTTKSIRYTDDNGRIQRVNLYTDRVLVNGQRKQLTMNDFDFSGYDGGYVKLQKNDKDEYDYIEIVKYNNHIVSAVNKSSNTLWFDDNTNLKLDKDDYNNDILINLLDMYYNEKTIDDINVGDVISIYKSENGRFIGAFHASTRFTGVIQTINNEEKEIQIDNKTYRVTCAINCDAGSEYDFSLDFRNQIAKIGTLSSSANYAYLLKVYSDECDDVYFKIFDPYTNSVRDFGTTSKIRINNGTYNNTDISEISGALGGDSNVSQLIQLTKDSKENINTIKTAKIGPDDDDFSLDYDKKGMYSASFGFIQGRYDASDASTMIIRIPKNRNDYEKYTSKMSMPVSCNLNAYLYDIDEKTNIPTVIVADMGTVVYTDDMLDYGPYAMVADIGKEVDENDELKTAVTYFILNKKEKVYYEDGEYLTDKSNNKSIAVDSLVRGDILQVVRESNKIAIARMIYKSDARGSDSGFVQGTHIGSVNNKFISYGNIKSVYGQRVIIHNPDSGLEVTVNIGSARVYRYKVKMNKAEIVNNAALEYGQKVIFRSVDGVMGDMVIIEEE